MRRLIPLFCLISICVCFCSCSGSGSDSGSGSGTGTNRPGSTASLTDSGGTTATAPQTQVPPAGSSGKTTATAPGTSVPETLPHPETTRGTDTARAPGTPGTPSTPSTHGTHGTPGTASAPGTSRGPGTSAPDLALPDPGGLAYREDHTIVYATKGAVLILDGREIPVEADTAMIRTGTGTGTGAGEDGYDRVLWLGRTGYISAGSLTVRRPESAAKLAAEKGGIYYKGPGPLVAIDAGHQNRAMTDKEPLGPGSSEMKNKLSSGTQGVATRLEEYRLNLSVALLLRDELIARGYGVVMIRETDDVRLSNAERAQIANAYGAGAFIRIHANGSENSSARGAFTLCQTPKNPYNGGLYKESRALAEDVLSGFIARTGFARNAIWETDTMTGINWANIPVTLIEMGYMSNPDEDRIMASADFQSRAAAGMADGLDRYFGRGEFGKN